VDPFRTLSAHAIVEHCYKISSFGLELGEETFGTTHLTKILHFYDVSNIYCLLCSMQRKIGWWLSATWN